MKMKTTKTITVSGREIIRDYVCNALNISMAEYNKRFSEDPLEIYWDIKETGDHDRGTYNRELKEVRITIEE